MNENLDKAILAASDKNYSEFEKALRPELETKMSDMMGSFIKYLNKSAIADAKGK